MKHFDLKNLMAFAMFILALLTFVFTFIFPFSIINIAHLAAGCKGIP